MFVGIAGMRLCASRVGTNEVKRLKKRKVGKVGKGKKGWEI